MGKRGTENAANTKHFLHFFHNVFSPLDVNFKSVRSQQKPTKTCHLRKQKCVGCALVKSYSLRYKTLFLVRDCFRVIKKYLTDAVIQTLDFCLSP